MAETKKQPSIYAQAQARSNQENVSTFGEIGRGIGAGLVGIPQGLTELASTAYDFMADDDTTQNVTAFFEEFKPDTKTGVGNFFQYATQFGIPGLGAVGVLSKAGKLNTLNVIGTSAASDFAFATNDVEPLMNMLLEPGSDADKKQLLDGAELAAENILDRFKIGIEAATIVTGAPIAIKYGARGVGAAAGAASKIPGVQQGADVLSDFSFKFKDGLKNDEGTAGKMFNYIASKTTAKGGYANQLAFLAKAQKDMFIGARVLGVEQNFQNVNTILKDLNKAGVIEEADKLFLSKQINEYISPMQRGMYEAPKNIDIPKIKYFQSIQNDAKQALIKKEAEIIKTLEASGKKQLANRLKKDGIFKNADETRQATTALSNELYDLTDPDRLVSRGIENAQGKDAIFVNQGTREIVKQYESVYGTRMYRNMEETGFEINPQFRQEAIDEIAKMGDADPRMAADAFDELASGNWFGSYTFDKPVALESFQTGILKGRKLDDMPAVRRALGEIEGYTTKTADETLANTALSSSLTINRMASLVGKAKSFEKILLTNQEASQLGVKPFLEKFDVPKLDSQGKQVIGEDGLPQMIENPNSSLIRNGVTYEKITDNNMGALRGYFVKPEMKKALEGSTKALADGLPGFLSPMYKAFLGAKGASALAKTVFSPITQVRNAAGGFFFTAANGNLGRSGNFGQAFAATMGPIGAKFTPQQQKELLQETLDLGVINSSASFKEIEGLLDDSSKVWKDITKNIPGSAKAGKVIEDTVKNGMMSKLYIAGDDVWKIYNWKVELDKLTNAFTKHSDKAIPITFTDNLLFLKSLGDDVLENTGTLTRFEGGLTKNKLNQALRNFENSPNFARSLLEFMGKSNSPQTKLGAANIQRVINKESGFTIADLESMMLKKEAANVVADNVPNYSRVPDFVKGLRQLPIGNFVSFPAEIVRTSGNILGRSIKELASDNPLIREAGMQRMAGGMVVGGALGPAVQATGRALTGVDEEQIDAYRRSFAAPWDRAATLIPIASDSKGNVTELYNFSYTNPYDYMARPFRALALRANEGIAKGEDITPMIMGTFYESMSEMFAPFVSPSIITQALADVATGETQTGRKLFNEGDPMGFKMGTTFAHLLESINPGVSPISFSADPGSGAPLYIKGRIKDFPKSVLVSTGLTGEDTGYTKSGIPLDSAEELVQAFTGFKNIKIQTDRSLRYRGYEAAEDAKTSSNLFNRVAKSRDPRSAQEITNAYITADESRFKALRDLGLAIEDARLLGLDEGTIATQLSKAKVPNRGLIMNNMFMPAFPSSEVLSESIISEKDKVGQTIPFGSIANVFQSQIAKPLIQKPNIQQPTNVQSRASDVLRQEELNKILTGKP